MKKIIALILVAVAFASAGILEVDRGITKAVKQLKNCTVYSGVEAYEKGVSQENVKEFAEYGRAVYFECDNGYFMYSQHRLKGTFIRGNVCKTGHYDYVDGCQKSESYFLVSSFPYKNGSSDGYFIETDNYGIRLQDEEFKCDGQKVADIMNLKMYKLLQK